MALNQLCTNLQGFVAELFRVPAVYGGLILRGFYLVATTEPDAVQTPQSYFTKGLLSEIIWRDQGRTQPTSQATHRLWHQRMALAGGALVVATALLVGLPPFSIGSNAKNAATETPSTLTESALLPAATLRPLATLSPTRTPTQTPTATATSVPSATSTPSVTPTPTITPSPTSTPIVAVVNRNANLRIGPGTSFATVTVVPANREIEVIGQNETRDWVLLKSGEWIATFLLNNVPETLPTLDPTRTP